METKFIPQHRKRQTLWFGKIKIEIDEIKWRPYLEIFKEYLNKNGISIEDNIQFKEWFAMGSLPSNDIDENLLQYPLIELLDENNRLQNEFNNYKKKTKKR